MRITEEKKKKWRSLMISPLMDFLKDQDEFKQIAYNFIHILN